MNNRLVRIGRCARVYDFPLFTHIEKSVNRILLLREKAR